MGSCFRWYGLSPHRNCIACELALKRERILYRQMGGATIGPLIPGVGPVVGLTVFEGIPIVTRSNGEHLVTYRLKEGQWEEVRPAFRS